MAIDKDQYVGRPTGKWKISVERGPVSNFATAVKDTNPVYHDLQAAKAVGFDDIPAPPTWGFSMTHWGAYPEQQPADNPAKDGPSPVMEIIGTLMKSGGLVLHGEQEFEYHRPLTVGDVLDGEGRVVDVYEKQSGERTMTFLVTENEYRDQSGELVLTTRMNLIHRS
ncbi:MAG TPA: MaoC family dehydratase N-terminal domain-containing protein [Acidimicrobiia bacterium]|nr:MaoC family dehydratase N-terminal domain-containing protein [Acidimicrobiia bacterium]